MSLKRGFLRIFAECILTLYINPVLHCFSQLFVCVRACVRVCGCFRHSVLFVKALLDSQSLMKVTNSHASVFLNKYLFYTTNQIAIQQVVFKWYIKLYTESIYTTHLHTSHIYNT